MTSNPPDSKKNLSPGNGILPFVKRRSLTFLSIGLSVLVVFAWWQSSRYSERHLVYLGEWTLEVFSASSLLRVSLVRGHIPRLGASTNYRQPNARGKFLMRPVAPTFRPLPDMWEVTLGYWHLAALSATFAPVAWIFENRRATGRN